MTQNKVLKYQVVLFMSFKIKLLNIHFIDITVIPLYSEPGYSEYPLIVNDLLCTEHSIVETNGE